MSQKLKKITGLISIDGKCAPGAFNKNTESCLSKEQLLSLVALYNEHCDKKDKIHIGKYKNEAKLYKTLKTRLSNICEDDYCWINQPFVKSSEFYDRIKNNYRPQKPFIWNENKYTWLNTSDILNVMNQYSNKYPKYIFLGVFPIDFMETYNNSSICIRPTICGFHINDLIEKNKEEFGIILNLDKHDQNGSHWVSIYGNINPKSKKFGICYYDSTGSKPNNYVIKFINIFKSQVETVIGPEISKKMTVTYNNIEHQVKSSECGIFSMIFNILCIENKNETYITTLKRIPKGSDEIINTYRNKLYVPTM